MRFPLVAAACAALLCMAPALAAPKAPRAAPVDPIAAKLKESEARYAAGQYREAAELLEQLMQEAPNPAILYNLARAWDQAGELERALRGYQSYVSSPDGTDPTRLKRSSLSIDRIKGILAQKEADRRAAEEEIRRAEDEAREAKARAQKEAAAARAAAEAAEEEALARAENEARSRSALRVGAVVSGVLGVAALGGGTWYGLQSRSSYGTFKAARGDTQEAGVALKQQLQAQTRQQALFADVGFAVGAAALVTAILLWPKGGGEDADTHHGGEHDAPAADEPAPAEEEEDVSWQFQLSPVSAGLLVRF
jgi:tetratricopeptide (TPR) repeat protein